MEHELLLAARLRAAGITFWTEDDLRAQGMHKTPDVRLQVSWLFHTPCDRQC